MAENKLKFDFTIKPEDRKTKLKQRPQLIWFTGLSASGKSSLANALEVKLFQTGFHTYILDGDNLRNGINKGLGFSAEDRRENLRRAAEIANLFLQAGIIVIGAFVSPFAKDREMIREIVGEKNFIEIYVCTPIEVCEQRDQKGLYKKARAGEILDFTGIGSSYEAPKKPFCKVDSSFESVDKIINDIFPFLTKRLDDTKT